MRCDQDIFGLDGPLRVQMFAEAWLVSLPLG